MTSNRDRKNRQQGARITIAQGLLWLAPYGAAALVLLGLARSGISESIDLLLYDTITTLRQAPSSAKLPITIIGIDEADIDHYGWPIDDGILCRAVSNALAAQASVVGVDLYRDQGIGPQRACLGKLSRQHRQLITIFNLAEAIGPVPGSPAQQQAFNDLLVDPDGVVRRDLVHVSGQNAATVALPLRLIAVAHSKSNLLSRLQNPRSAEQLGPWLQQRSGGYRQLDAGGYQRMLPFLKPGSITSWSLRALADAPIAVLKPGLKEQIVLIGSIAPSLKDLFTVPSSRFAQTSQDLRLSGVELHAMRLAGLMAADQAHPWAIQTLPGTVDNGLELLALALGAWLGEAFRHLRRSALAVLLALGLIASIGVAALWWWGLWLAIALPLIGLALMATVGWLRRGALSQLHQQQMQRLLGQTTSPEVAQQLWEQRDGLLENGRFAGRQLPVTILFSDTCNFTSVSEQFSPPNLLNWLNRGMRLMVPAVTRRGGMVNKFTGDGMLAVFGAPLGKGEKQDAQDAIETALEIQERLIALNHQLLAEGEPAMLMRIGVHSGFVLAGSMGSNERLEYAIIGDAVNCASRLESLDKTRQNNICRVLVSGTTYGLLQHESLQWRSWGTLQLKGRKDPLQVWELLGTSAESISGWDSEPEVRQANQASGDQPSQSPRPN